MSSFINISEASNIAIHSMALIAHTKNGLNAGEIADITRFSKSHLSKVLHILVKHNYLTSLRGPNGGFAISKDPKCISLLDIYQLIEGVLIGFECAITCGSCYFEACIYGKHLSEFSGNFEKYLKDMTLADIKISAEIKK
ncbi:MAG: Rrf2 family transcriptional regulator [Bacteroidales bacterium]|nr:Rrf2 family transcriptional regulator [Bacteroidales bacterium]